MSKLHTRCAGGKIAVNNMADVEEEIFAASKFISSFSPLSDLIVSFKLKPSKTSVLGSQNILEETRTWGFHTLVSELRVSDRKYFFISPQSTRSRFQSLQIMSIRSSYVEKLFAICDPRSSRSYGNQPLLIYYILFLYNALKYGVLTFQPRPTEKPTKNYLQYYTIIQDIRA